MTWLPLKTSITIAAFLAIAALPEFVPLLANYKIVDWKSLDSVLDFHAKNIPSQAEAEQARLNPDAPLYSDSIYPLLDPGASLDHFYEALRQTEMRADGAVTRILHYGDSPTTADLITADLRILLQKQFGDAGHGYVLVAKPWAWYGHRGFEISNSGWQITPANQSEVRNGLFGLGGVVFRGSPGSVSRLSTHDTDYTQVEIAYLHEPSGGLFEVLADGKLLGEIDTKYPQIISGFTSFPIPPESKRFEIRVKSGNPRLFGAHFSKPGPGIIYNSLGVNGAYVAILSRMFQERHWSEQLQHYKPDLIIVNYGTNESVYASFVDTSYKKELREVIRRIHSAVPEASVLVMSPMDRGERLPTGEIASVPALVRLVNLQQQIAADTGCGFFNTFQAMGGPGTMGRWYNAEQRLVSADFIHPMPGGAKLVGNLLYRALTNGYNKYKMRRMQERLAAAGPIDQKVKAAAAR
ncbi:MAG: GDSL-type esterase/lipase family protein [Bryobacteraceae bacterium]